MDRRRKYLKALALVPAIVLGGAFVGCHAGAFKMFEKEKPAPQPDPQPVAEPQLPAVPPQEKPPLFMSGTKSISNKGLSIGLIPADETSPTTPRPPLSPTPPPPVFIGGPKSAPIITPTPGAQPPKP